MVNVSMLFELQKVFDKEQECKNDLKRLTRNVQEIEKKVEVAQKAYLQVKTQWHKKKTDLDDLSMQLSILEEDKKKYEKDLFSPKNSNPKFLKDMENKIIEIKRNIDKQEEKVFQLMDENERYKTETEKREAALNQLQQALQEHNQIVEETQKEIAILLEELNQKRDSIEKQLPAKDKEAFQKAYLNQNKAVALVVMPDACCSACKFQVPRQIADTGKKNPNELYYCENCSRILYFIA